ncbi:MAG TPA: acetyl-CoA carboxylase biotin carboxyl carrier protein [Acetobacteraceae bacterium]|nr:acetyl-CoA carboxylase biotin carboxyl carrier protein [Acetobacteraceae bacterium]
MTRFPFDPDSIRALADILVETGLTEIEVAEKDSRIRVVRQPVMTAPVHVAAAPPAAAPAAAAAGAQATAAAEEDLATHPGAVLSPMVGIVYLAPEPGAEPYVAVGRTVAAGQTLLLIEAMKTFNQIRAPRAGTVTRILAASGTPVEYGEPLMVID